MRSSTSSAAPGMETLAFLLKSSVANELSKATFFKLLTVLTQLDLLGSFVVPFIGWNGSQCFDSLKQGDIVQELKILNLEMSQFPLPGLVPIPCGSSVDSDHIE